MAESFHFILRPKTKFWQKGTPSSLHEKTG